MNESRLRYSTRVSNTNTGSLAAKTGHAARFFLSKLIPFTPPEQKSRRCCNSDTRTKLLCHCNYAYTPGVKIALPFRSGRYGCRGAATPRLSDTGGGRSCAKHVEKSPDHVRHHFVDSAVMPAYFCRQRCQAGVASAHVCRPAPTAWLDKKGYSACFIAE